MSESFEEELRKVCMRAIFYTRRSLTAQLQLNLENAEKTYGPSSAPCQAIRRIIDDFIASHEPPPESQQNGLQLPFRPKSG
jgi:hypothetical protein